MADTEFFSYKCPHCSTIRNAADVAAELPDAVLKLITGRRNALRPRRRGAGTGRPILARCPGCSQEMSAAELREHRVPCVRQELKKLIGRGFLLSPKDPDPYPTFYVHHMADDATEVDFHKGSNGSVITVDLRKISEILVRQDGLFVDVRLLGRVIWNADTTTWEFAPTAAVGRPPKLGASL